MKSGAVRESRRPCFYHEGAGDMPYKVVIADKVDLIRDIYENAIEQSEGYTLAASFDKPAQAVAYLANNSADIVVMNLIPGAGMNGIEAAEKIKSLRPEVKIIITAVLPNAEDAAQTQKAGIEGLWTAQADEKAFLDVMSRVMAGEKVYPL